MRSRFLTLLAALSIAFGAKADGFEYRFDFDGISDTVAYLAYHYGDKQYIADTLLLDAQGKTVAQADTLLPPGVYMMVFPSMDNAYFEFVVNEPKFSVTGNTEDFVGSLAFKGSKENTLMYEDLRYLADQRKKTDPLSAQLQSTDPNSEAYGQIREQIDAIDREVRAKRQEIFKKHKGLLYTAMLKGLQEPEVPEAPRDAEGNITDSLFQFRAVRRQALSFVDWEDERLLRTPVIYNVMYRYLNQYSYRSPDSLAVSVDNILAKAKGNKEVFRYCLIWLLNEYANSSIMGMDAVYVHIALTYYDTGEAWWLDEAQKFRIVDRAKRMQPTLIGKQAPNIRMKDTKGQTRSLYDLESDYTVVYFWDPDCSHCKKETPVLGEEFKKLKPLYDIQVFAVNTQLEIEKWLKFIDAKDLNDFIHVADFDQNSDFRSRYDINGTPALFLLDKDKTIIAKRLVSDQLVDFMKAYEAQNGRP
jgi:peroxiredoxin